MRKIAALYPYLIEEFRRVTKPGGLIVMLTAETRRWPI